MNIRLPPIVHAAAGFSRAPVHKFSDRGLDWLAGLPAEGSATCSISQPIGNSKNVMDPPGPFMKPAFSSSLDKRHNLWLGPSCDVLSSRPALSSCSRVVRRASLGVRGSLEAIALVGPRDLGRVRLPRSTQAAQWKKGTGSTAAILASLAFLSLF